ncbi:MAG TPA: tetratricopeptide repeat protein, partial [Candidatus Hydrogenedentes bacterium]|nr:tetratricopeptide repeat protein [Candidatus Hydrogenedentota bacterium]
LGRALHRQGALGDAIPLLERSVALRPDDTRARLTLAQALAEAGQTEEALSHARRVALERPDWEQARQLLQTLQQPDRLTQSGNP